MSQDTSTVGNVVPDALSALQDLFFNDLAEDQPGLTQGLMNLACLPEFDLKKSIPASVPGHGEVKRGILGFRRMGGQMTLAMACGTAPIHYQPLDKYIAMVEGMHDERSANVIIQNHKTGDDGRSQIIARLNPKHSAIHVVHGVVGRVIKEPSHILTNDVYYIPRGTLGRYYLAAKAQIEAGDQLDSLIAAYDGFKGYSIPIDPFNPVGV